MPASSPAIADQNRSSPRACLTSWISTPRMSFAICYFTFERFGDSERNVILIRRQGPVAVFAVAPVDHARALIRFVVTLLLLFPLPPCLTHGFGFERRRRAGLE